MKRETREEWLQKWVYQETHREKLRRYTVLLAPQIDETTGERAQRLALYRDNTVIETLMGEKVDWFVKRMNATLRDQQKSWAR